MKLMVVFGTGQVAEQSAMKKGDCKLLIVGTLRN